MLKKGYLATNGIYLSTAHSEKIINEYLNALDPIFKKFLSVKIIAIILIDILLDGPVCHSGFKRLN